MRKITLILAILTFYFTNAQDRSSKIIEWKSTSNEILKDIKIQDKTGAKHNLTDYINANNQGKIVVLTTFFDFCAGCINGIIKPLLNYNKENSNFILIPLNVNYYKAGDKFPSPSKTHQDSIIKNIRFGNHTLFNPDNSFNNLMSGKDATPYTLLIKDGIIIYSNFGSLYFPYSTEGEIIIALLKSKEKLYSNKLRYKDGTRIEFGFDHFKREGTWIWHDKYNPSTPSEGIYKKLTFKNGKKNGEEKNYYENGKLKSAYTNKDGEIEGKAITYYESGQIKYIGEVHNGVPIGEEKFYYENGKLHQILNYTAGKRTGEAKIYHENGKLQVIGNFTDGKQTGEWKQYDANGTLIKKEIYNNGELLKSN